MQGIAKFTEVLSTLALQNIQTVKALCITIKPNTVCILLFQTIIAGNEQCAAHIPDTFHNNALFIQDLTFKLAKPVYHLKRQANNFKDLIYC